MENANVIRTKQKQIHDKRNERIIEYHLKNIRNFIDFYKSDRQCIYTFSKVIPGFQKILNNNYILKTVAKQIQREGYTVERISQTQIMISWKIANKERLATYIKQLLFNISTNINKSLTESDDTCIKYCIPPNIYFDDSVVQYYLHKYLVQRKFKVSQDKDMELIISWS